MNEKGTVLSLSQDIKEIREEAYKQGQQDLKEELKKKIKEYGFVEEDEMFLLEIIDTLGGEDGK